ncbi:MAG: winged helix-turn-helix transcriptional regulator [Thermoplasmata archaeon]|jgi:DNA-binding HxlR family transcriptional regulator|nr:MAG: transcriptional regulator [Aciduliprofundum sp.]
MEKKDCVEHELACMVDYRGRTICILPSERVLNILGKKYTLLIIALLGNREKVNFNEIMKKTGCPRPNLLSMRLKELENQGLIRREIISGERPIRVDYSLTPKGKRLRKLILPILAWIEENSSS